MKDFTISITSKGQLTMPASVRRDFKIPEAGVKLKAHYNEKTKRFTIDRPVTIDDIQAFVQSRIKPGTPPLLDAHAFYETRPPRL